MKHLTLAQRYELESMLKASFSQIEIALKLGVHKSTISRELKRNSMSRSNIYRAELAQYKCDTRHKFKTKHIRFTDEMRNQVDNYLRQDYSPEQITGYLSSLGIDCVSHERIYQYVWREKHEGGILYRHLRRQGKKYAKRGSKYTGRGKIPNRIDISKRPEIVDAKVRFGDLELDTVVGVQHKSALVTINDRVSGMLKMKKVTVKETRQVCKVIVELLEDWKPYVKTITADNGSEFASHHKVSEQIAIDFYFARPYHAWQRGANENLNGLIRQYFPKGIDFKDVSDHQIKVIENKLNNRPRKRFNFKTPLQKMEDLLFNQKVAFMT